LTEPSHINVVVRSREDLRRFLTGDAEIFPDNRVQLDTVAAEGDLVAFWATYTGTQKGAMGSFAASGKRVSVEFAGVFRMEDGRIADVRLVWDNVTLLRQLGHLSAAL